MSKQAVKEGKETKQLLSSLIPGEEKNVGKVIDGEELEKINMSSVIPVRTWNWGGFDDIHKTSKDKIKINTTDNMVALEGNMEKGNQSGSEKKRLWTP